MLVFSGCGKKKEDAKTYQKENDVKNVSSENTNSQDNKVSSSEKNENSTSDKN